MRPLKFCPLLIAALLIYQSCENHKKTYHYDNGAIKRTEISIADTLFISDFDTIGNIVSKFKSVNNKLEGSKINYYENGNIECRENYEDDLLHGQTFCYYPNGVIKADLRYFRGDLFYKRLWDNKKRSKFLTIRPLVKILNTKVSDLLDIAIGLPLEGGHYSNAKISIAFSIENYRRDSLINEVIFDDEPLGDDFILFKSIQVKNADSTYLKGELSILNDKKDEIYFFDEYFIGTK